MGIRREKHLPVSMRHEWTWASCLGTLSTPAMIAEGILRRCCSWEVILYNSLETRHIWESRLFQEQIIMWGKRPGPLSNDENSRPPAGDTLLTTHNRTEAVAENVARGEEPRHSVQSKENRFKRRGADPRAASHGRVLCPGDGHGAWNTDRFKYFSMLKPLKTSHLLESEA